MLPYLQQNPDTTIVVRDLLKRDFANWTLLRHGSRLFKPGGIKHEINKRWLNELPVFEKWTSATTENEEVNAAITKLISTGYLTTTERNLAADYLSNELGINWTWGAMFFESYLIDYNVSGNWVRWNTDRRSGQYLILSSRVKTLYNVPLAGYVVFLKDFASFGQLWTQSLTLNQILQCQKD